MSSLHRQALKWNRKLHRSKALRVFFFVTVFGGLVGSLLFGHAFVLYVAAPAISLLFMLFGASQAYIAFGYLSHKAILEAIPFVLFAGVLIGAGVSIVYGVLSGAYT